LEARILGTSCHGLGNEYGIRTPERNFNARVRISSLKLGQISFQCLFSFDLEFPIECDDEYWEAKDGNQAFVQPAGQPSLVSFWSCYLKLVEIIGFAQQTLVS